jgi:hypothetical protein
MFLHKSVALITSFEQVSLFRSIKREIDTVFIFCAHALDSKLFEDFSCDIIVVKCDKSKDSSFNYLDLICATYRQRKMVVNQLAGRRVYHAVYSVDWMLALLLFAQPHATLLLSVNSKISAKGLPDKCKTFLRTPSLLIKYAVAKMISRSIDLLEIDGESFIGIQPSVYPRVMAVEPEFGGLKNLASSGSSRNSIAILGYDIQSDMHYFGPVAVRRLIRNALAKKNMTFKFHPGSNFYKYFNGSHGFSGEEIDEISQRLCPHDGAYEEMGEILEQVYCLGSKGVVNLAREYGVRVTVFCSSSARNLGLVKHLCNQPFPIKLIICS